MTTATPLSELLANIDFEQLEVDPYPFYARLREEAPVVHVPAMGAWLVTSFEEVREVHADSERYACVAPESMMECVGEHNILGLDGPRHQRYRRGLHACLAPRVVEGYTDSEIVPVVDAQLDRLADRRSAELVAEYFEPISVLALGRVVGIPEISAETLRRWFHGIILGTGNVAGDPEVAAEANGISREIDERMWEVFERIDGTPSDTIVSHLLRHAEGATLQERVDDITPTLKIVFGGGLQEPGHGASTLMCALLSDEALFERFVADPGELIRPAIEEAVRWVAPIQVDGRRTTTDVELGGVQIPAGSDVFPSVASANRDRSVFGDDADRFDVDRPRVQHLGFGFGSHFCSGNYFGRVVMRLAVQRLVERHPTIRLDPAHTPQFRGFAFRAPAALHVQWD